MDSTIMKSFLKSDDAKKGGTLTATKESRQTIANTPTSVNVLKPMTLAEIFSNGGGPLSTVKKSATLTGTKKPRQTIANTKVLKPMTLAEIFSNGGGPLSTVKKSATLTGTKKPRQTIANAKVLKPMTLAEIFTNCRGLQTKSPRNNVKVTTASKQKWNSSTKMVNKTVSHTANGQMKHNAVRKNLNFQLPKPKETKSFTNKRMTTMNTEISKFPRPNNVPAKKPLYQQVRNTIRISGICNIPETPVLIKKQLKNKENISNTNVTKKAVITPKSTLRKMVLTSRLADTPLSNESWKSSCDSSFLQNERDIECIAEESTSVSTPFTEYRNVEHYFNNTHNSTDINNHDSTIMYFNNTVSKDNSKEESIIVSLCEILNKAKVTTETQSTELDDLLEVEKQSTTNIQMIENGIRTLNSIKEAQLKSLQCVKKLIQDITQRKSVTLKENNNKPTKDTPRKDEMSKGNRNSLSKSPSYVIPKRNSLIKKRLSLKSMPNLQVPITPQKAMGDRALSMYLQLKEQNNYLTTPLRRPTEIPNTPAMTSHNLQQQLDRLYN